MKVSLPIKIIPGLWYCADYADNINFTNANSTDPVSVITIGTTNTTLSAPATDANTFYRVRVGASKAALSGSASGERGELAGEASPGFLAHPGGGLGPRQDLQGVSV